MESKDKDLYKEHKKTEAEIVKSMESMPTEARAMAIAETIENMFKLSKFDAYHQIATLEMVKAKIQYDITLGAVRDVLSKALTTVKKVKELE